MTGRGQEPAPADSEPKHANNDDRGDEKAGSRSTELEAAGSASLSSPVWSEGAARLASLVVLDGTALPAAVGGICADGTAAMEPAAAAAACCE